MVHLAILTAVLVAAQPAPANGAPPARTVVITGRVLGPDGKPPPDVFISAARLGAPRQADEAEDDGDLRVVLCCSAECAAESLAFLKNLHDSSAIACAKADGSFEIAVEEQGPYILLVQPRGLLPQTIAVVAPTKSLVVSLKAGLSVSGRVLDAAGRPLAGVALTVEPRSNDTPGFADPRFLIRQQDAVSGRNGAFRVDGLSAGRHQVCAQYAGPTSRGGRKRCVGFEVKSADVVVNLAATTPDEK